MLRIDRSTRKIQMKLAGAVATSQIPCTLSYVDIGVIPVNSYPPYAGSTKITLSNNTTAVDICTAPANNTVPADLTANIVRAIDSISVCNVDTAAVTVTLYYNDNGTQYELLKATVLSVGDTLTYSSNGIWTTTDSTGSVKSIMPGYAPLAGAVFTGPVTVTTLTGTDTTDATSSVAAAWKTAGGLAVAKKINVGTDAAIGGNALIAGTLGAAATTITTLVGSDATDSSSSTTGAFKTAGGLGIAKKLYVGTSANIGTTLAVGLATPLTAAHVQAAYTANRGVVQIDDTAAQAAGTGGGVSFGGKFTDAGAYTSFAAIRAAKTNSTTANYSAGLSFLTYTDGDSNMTERMSLSNAGLLTVNKSAALHSATAIPAGGTAGAGLMVSSTANFGVFFGSGAPSLSAAKGSLYLRSDGSSTSTRMYVNTDGGTTWTAVTTAA